MTSIFETRCCTQRRRRRFQAQSCGLTNQTTGTPRRLQVFGEAEVDVGEVDEDGDVGAVCA